MAHPIPENLLPQDCMCEADHGPRGDDGAIPPCKEPATLVELFDGTPIPLCQTCLDEKHNDEPYRSEHRG